MDYPDNDVESDESVLVERARRGDRRAFDRLAARYRPVVQALVYGRVGYRSEAEDLVQDVLAAAWAKLPSLRDAPAFAGWIRAIATNACWGWRRRSVAWPESLDSVSETKPMIDPSSGPLEILLARERARSWRKAFDRIPIDNRIALLLHVWGGLSYAEIARVTGATVTTVEGRIHRAKTQLRQVIEGDPDQLIYERRRWRPEAEP